jgi:hypothetical protein
VCSSDLTPWGTNPLTASFEIWENVNGVYTNRSLAMITTNAVSVAGDVIASGLVQNLDEGHSYLGMFRFSFGVTTEASCTFHIFAEK